MATPASDVWSLGVLAYPNHHSSMHQGSSSENNVALRASTRALLEGGLLDGMLGTETSLSKMKNIQLATQVNELKESMSDAKVKEKMMELSMEKHKLEEETKKLEHQLRSVQKSLQRTRERNSELEKKEDLIRCQHLLANQTPPISIDPKIDVLSTTRQISHLIFHHDAFTVKTTRRKITRTVNQWKQVWCTTLLKEPISEGVVSVAIRIKSMPNKYDEELMFGLVDVLARRCYSDVKLGDTVSNSIAISPLKGTLNMALPSVKQCEEKRSFITDQMKEGDRIVLEVDMDARPRTAVFIINGNVPLTFVSGLPPSIRIGFSMKNEGVSVRFEGISRLKRATPLRRVNEIKWNPEELRDSEDMYMNGMRSSVLTVQTQMPPLVFADPSHFRVENNIVTTTVLATKDNNDELSFTEAPFLLGEPISEGIVAISFTVLVNESFSSSSFNLIDEMAPIPEIWEALGKIHKKKSFDLWADKLLDFSTPISEDGSVTINIGVSVRFDRITNLNRASPIIDRTNVIDWSTVNPLKATESEEDVTSLEQTKRHLPTMKLPELLSTHKSHFAIQNNVLTRTEKGTDENEINKYSTVLISEPITKGVVSVTFVILTLAELLKQKGFIYFGCLDSSATMPQLEYVLGDNVKHSVSLSTTGDMHLRNRTQLEEKCSVSLSMNTRVVMEVNMNSTPRTVQFFVNGKAGKCFVSGIPASVRIGFSASMMGTSLQITNIVHSTQSTPLADGMKEIRWTDTEQSLKERNENQSKPFWREAEGWMPALLCRNPEHFKIEGNVITRTAYDFAGLNSPLSTILLDVDVLKTVEILCVTILALPQTEHSCGVIMFGCLSDEPLAPKIPDGLGSFGLQNLFSKITRNSDACNIPRASDAFPLCSLDGRVHLQGWDTSYSVFSHSPLKVGDEVLFQVDRRKFPRVYSGVRKPQTVRKPQPA
ncbi:hypothetical protein BLNAU_17356 [Blattamonas nauphoetae]|uniref:Uncharacterized protein n=1 Tax=Blattamonas nauphoetae TaxID=2049346 RepID=A0ABQ9X7B0_9EUKA|nr:hypothetical protein BLNAU_17356 [Blattamonas nauphoetae]